jgi:hypothetical protein
MTALKTPPTLVRAALTSAPRASRLSLIVTPARITLLVAVALWATALPLVATAKVNAYGLLFAGVPGIVGGALLTVVALVLAVRRSNAFDAGAAVAIIVLISRLTATITLNEPGSTFVFRHLGVIDYIQANGALSPGTDIYNGWPGAFAAVAWFSDVTGVQPLVIAEWFPALCDLAFAAAVFLLCRAFGQAPVMAFVGAFIASIVNWVGQDYLSPQAFGILLATLILTLLVESRKHPIAGWLTLPLFVALVVTHQLTPYWLIVVTIALGITGHIRPRLIGLVFIVIAGLYLIPNYGQVSGQGVLSSLNPIANATTYQNGVVNSAGANLAALTAKIPSIALWGSAVIIGVATLRVKRLRGTAPVWVPAVFAFSSFSLLFTQNYGGEAIFRVFLYSIPGCAVLVAPWLTRVLRASPRTRARRAAARRSKRTMTLRSIVAAAAVMVVLLAGLQSYYGGWFANLVRKDSVVAVTNWLETTEAPAMLLSPTVGVPLRPVADYVKFATADSHYDASLSTWTGWAGSSFTNPTLVDTFTKQLADVPVDTYVMVTKQTKIYSDFYGVYPKGALTRLADQLEHHEGWTTIIDTPTLQLFKYTGSHK